MPVKIYPNNMNSVSYNIAKSNKANQAKQSKQNHKLK